MRILLSVPSRAALWHGPATNPWTCHCPTVPLSHCHAAVPVWALCAGVQSAPAPQGCVLGCRREAVAGAGEMSLAGAQGLLSCVR